MPQRSPPTTRRAAESATETAHADKTKARECRHAGAERPREAREHPPGAARRRRREAAPTGATGIRHQEPDCPPATTTKIHLHTPHTYTLFRDPSKIHEHLQTARDSKIKPARGRPARRPQSRPRRQNGARSPVHTDVHGMRTGVRTCSVCDRKMPPDLRRYENDQGRLHTRGRNCVPAYVT